MIKSNKNFTVFLILFITTLLISSYFFSDVCSAQEYESETEQNTPSNQFPNPLGNEDEDANVNILIGRVINAALGVVGSLALLMFVYGGFTWMLAAGNNERMLIYQHFK